MRWARKAWPIRDVPATAVMRVAMGDTGARLIALGITISTLGFLSQSVLTAPRVYFAMARDGLFFRSVARVTEHTHVPVVAIIAAERVDCCRRALRPLRTNPELCGLDGFSLLRTYGGQPVCLSQKGSERPTKARAPGYRVPGHPVTTAVFMLVCWLVVINTIYKYPANSLLGMAILVLGLPVYAYWAAKQRKEERA